MRFIEVFEGCGRTRQGEGIVEGVNNVDDDEEEEEDEKEEEEEEDEDEKEEKEEGRKEMERYGKGS